MTRKDIIKGPVLKVLGFIHARRGFPPTYREIAEMLGCQVNWARECVNKLVAAGLVTRARKARSMVLTYEVEKCES